MKKILGFDSWTGGAHNFARLAPAFRDYGYELLLLHIGSWGGDTGRPVEETIGELKVRDISYYGGKSLLEILDIERPSVTLFLSNDVFAHRAFNRYCAIKKIPTVHLYHGLVEIQSTQGDRMYKVNILNQIKYVLNRIPKAVTKVWPLYACALYKSRSGFQEWIRFCSDIVNLTMGKYIQKAASDSRTNACAVYASADISHAINKYGYTTNDVQVVGNPDLAKFGLTDSMLGCSASRSRMVNNEIVYIDTGLIYAGMVFGDSDDFLEHLTTLAKTLKLQGFNLAIKLHPDHHRTDFPAEVFRHDIRVIDNEDFVPALLTCRAAMVEPSTAALIPALLGLPLILVAFGKLKNQKYGNILMDYPRSALLTDTKAVTATITRIENDDSSYLEEWIKRNSGPLPAEEMPKRVAEVIKRLIEQ
jgi:hypothetical protein